jgi:hypothetical protein
MGQKMACLGHREGQRDLAKTSRKRYVKWGRNGRLRVQWGASRLVGGGLIFRLLCWCAVLCCAVLCCWLFSTRSPPHAVLLATALSLSVVVRVLREGARVTWVCWCWLSCCRGALVLSPGIQPVIRSLVCWGAPKAGLFLRRGLWVSWCWCRCCGASCSKLFYPSRCLATR